MSHGEKRVLFGRLCATIVRMKENSGIKRIFDSLSFLNPVSLVKRNHLSRRDVFSIKKNLCMRLGAVNLIVSAIVAIADTMILLTLSSQANGDYVSTYGYWSFWVTFIAAIGSFLVFFAQIYAHFSSNERIAFFVSRIAMDVFYVLALSQLISSLYSDAQMGYTAGSEAISPSILLISILVVSQPAFWLDAIVLDLNTTVTIIVISFVCHDRFDMGGLGYYLLLALAFPIICYLVVNVFFFAECHHYVQALQNEFLHNRATFDELTKCKNRNALQSFLEENAKRWELKETNLLVIMFDIDNFKSYNDQFSHQGGDNCLRLVCDAIRNEFPSPSLDFYRYGGEEFLLFFEIDDPLEAKDLIERARVCVQNINMPAPSDAPKEHVTISLGGTVCVTGSPFDFSSVLQKVDEYLYQSKNNGKDVSCLDGELIRSQNL